jgi:ABC-2 type transport system ATP-binding protein
MSITLEFKDLSKTFGETHAVKNLSFAVKPGRITGFLGPNGSGKSTSLRCLTGLVTPTSGVALIDGKEYADLENPALMVGASLEATGFHPGRTGYSNLAVLADAIGLSRESVEKAIERVGMTFAKDNRVDTYSLGMKQRLALAGALLGEPEVLVLDEPANGLDPEGIAWMRSFLRDHAANGGTVLISSHVLAEVQQTVDDVVIISNGSLVKACSLEELVASTTSHIQIITPNVEEMVQALSRGIDDAIPTRIDRGNLHHILVEGLSAAQVGRIAFNNRIELHELSEHKTDLEDVFLSLTGGEN